MQRLAAFLVIFLAVALQGQTVDVAPATPAAVIVRSLVDGAPSDLRSFYAPDGYRLAWSRDGRATTQALALIATFKSADSKGLDPADYDAASWSPRLAAMRTDADLARFDVALTTTAIRFLSHLRYGRVHPHEAGFAFDASGQKVYLPAVVRELAGSADPASYIASLEPQHADYRRLIAALAKYRRIEELSRDSAPLPALTRLAAGDSWDALPQLALLLRLHGDLAPDAQIDDRTYDGAIVDAVKSFQRRHGLDPDGVIGRSTLAQLNVPASVRVAQIEWSLERWRWTPSQSDGRVILVNIPEFRLRAIDLRGGDELSMRVVVGKAAGHRTPLFEGGVQHVVFRPYWSVPPSIQRNEILPKLERDHGYLAKNNYELVDDAGRPAGSRVDAGTIARVRSGALRIRQKPGAGNALGLVKFLFPNDNNVYLHSTPQQSLFARSRRDFSHGCIRVEDPVALASWILGDRPEWTKEKVEAAMNGGRDDIYVKPSRPVDVVLIYATAVARENGEVDFYDDIYGHDVQLAKMLAPRTEDSGVMMAAR